MLFPEIWKFWWQVIKVHVNDGIKEQRTDWKQLVVWSGGVSQSLSGSQDEVQLLRHLAYRRISSLKTGEGERVGGASTGIKGAGVK